MTDSDEGSISGIFKPGDSRKLSAEVMEYRLQVMHGLYKEQKKEIVELKKLCEVMSRTVDRLNEEQKGRDKQIGRVWAAVIGGIMSLVVGIMLYLLTSRAPPSP